MIPSSLLKAFFFKELIFFFNAFVVVNAFYPYESVEVTMMRRNDVSDVIVFTDNFNFAKANSASNLLFRFSSSVIVNPR